MLVFRNKQKLIEEIFLQVHMFIYNFDFSKALSFKNCKEHLKKNFNRFSFNLVLTDFLDSITDSISHSRNLQVSFYIFIYLDFQTIGFSNSNIHELSSNSIQAGNDLIKTTKNENKNFYII